MQPGATRKMKAGGVSGMFGWLLKNMRSSAVALAGVMGLSP